MKDQIIKGCKKAISEGFGNYFVMKGLTWKELLAGYIAGNRLIDYQEAEIVGKISLLG